MKKSELVFTALLVPFDFLMIVLAGALAYSLRFSQRISEIRPIVFDLPFFEYLGRIFLIALFFIIIFALINLYNFRFRQKISAEFFQIVIGISAGILIITFFDFLQREVFSSRFIILAIWIFSIIFVFFGRTILRFLKKWMVGKYNYGVHRIVIIGGNGLSKIIREQINQNPSLGYRIIKEIKNYSIDEIKKIKDEQGIDEVLQCDHNLSREKTLEMIEFAEENHIDFKFVPDFLDGRAIDIDIENLAGLPIIEIKRTLLDGWGRIIKRIFDAVGSVIAIIIFSPVMLIISLAIKLESKGSIIYKNERASRYGLFKTYKFRTMYLKYCTGSEYDETGEAIEIEKKLIEEKSKRNGPVYKVLDDPRRTKVGKFLEKTSLDELPQFFNVLLGNMSLVGPRPHQPREVKKYEGHHKKVMAIKPGVTGLAQISGRSDLDFSQEVALDKFYIEHWSFILDLKIILKTPLAALARREE